MAMRRNTQPIAHKGVRHQRKEKYRLNTGVVAVLHDEADGGLLSSGASVFINKSSSVSVVKPEEADPHFSWYSVERKTIYMPRGRNS